MPHDRSPEWHRAPRADRDVPSSLPNLPLSVGSPDSVRASLVPDFDGDLEHVLRSVEDVLVTLVALNDNRDAGRQSGSMPAIGLDHRPDVAVGRIIASVFSARGQRGRQFMNGANYQHRPLCVVTLCYADLDDLAVVIAALENEVAAGDVMITSLVNRHRLSLANAACIHQVLTLEPTGDTEALIAAIDDGEHDVVFTTALDAAYRATIARVRAIWNPDPCAYDVFS